MQDPQRYRGPDGSIYEALPGGGYRRTPPPQQQAPAGPAIPGLIQMETPAQRAQAEERIYDRGRDAMRDAEAARRETRSIEANERAAEAADRSSQALTEGQSKALIYGTMMRGAEADYQRARQRGYDPTSGRNAFANAIDGIPWDGGFFPSLIRDNESDAGYQAERRWVEANLRQLTGAAAPQPEVTRTQGINFDRANDSLADQRYRTREDTYGATRLALGHASDRLPEDYPDQISGQPAPTVADGRTVEQADDALAVAPGEYAADYVARFDRDGDNRASVEEMQAAGWSFDYDAGKWFPPGGDAGSPPTPPAGPQGGSPPQGPQGGGRDASAAARTAQGEGLIRKIDAFAGGALDTLTFGMGDEIAAGVNTVLPMEPGAESIWTTSAGDAFRSNLDLIRGRNEADARDVPVSRGAGQVAGAFVPGTQVIGAARGANLATRIGRGAVAGAAYGGAYGFGSDEGNALQRADGAAKGAVIGTLAGGASPAALNVAGRVATPVGNALADTGRFAGRQIVNALGDNAPEALRTATQSNALARGLERFAGTNRPDINALNATREQLEGAVGRPVAAASVVNTGGRAMLRGVATRSDAARESAENFGQGTAEALPARVGQQGRRILSNDTRAPDDIRSALDAERSNMARTTYAEPYAQPVQIGEDIAGALSGAPGRTAIQRARAAAEAWQDTAVMAELDAMEAAVRAGQPLPQVSAGAVDRIRQALSGRGEKLAQNPATRAVGAGVQNRAGQVDEALDNVEGLAPARAAYRDTSRQIEAVDAGERFMGSAPDTVAADMRGAPASAQAPFRAAAARSIERAAGSTQTAPGVANRLAIPGTPQRQMMDETLGPDDARRLSDAMRGERDIYRGAQQVDPGVGSQTTNNAMKAGEAAGMVGDALSGRPLGVVRRLVGVLDSRGFNPQQAEAVLEAMTDPGRTDEVISILSERMSRREARNLTRALRYQLTIGPQSGQQN